MTDGDGSHWLARFARTNLRFLAFRQAPIAGEDRGRFIATALVCTWLAGLARHWDHTDPLWWQRFGLGSLAYLFAAAALVWLVGAPLYPRAWRYLDVLLFVALTSPLAWAHALPIDRWLSVEDAATTNAWILAVVATWRVALLVRHFKIVAGLPGWLAVTAALLPLAAIVAAATLWWLHHAMLDSGTEPDGPVSVPTTTSGDDSRAGVVIVLAVASCFLAPWLAMIYAAAVVMREAPEPNAAPRADHGVW
jgi:hypothetical protein